MPASAFGLERHIFLHTPTGALSCPMSSKHTATQADSAPEPALPFTPVPVRPRHDGWTPGKQVAFIHALAETACVDEACRRVGMSQQSAYALRRGRTPSASAKLLYRNDQPLPQAVRRAGRGGYRTPSTAARGAAGGPFRLGRRLSLANVRHGTRRIDRASPRVAVASRPAGPYTCPPGRRS